MLMMAKPHATRQRWIAKFGKFNFTIYHHSSKSNMDADVLSQIPCDKNIKAEVVKAIFKATIEDLGALMEAYACNQRAISSLILESSPT